MSEQQFPISLFDNVGDTRPKLAARTWPQLCTKFARPQIRAEKDGLLFSPARYSGNRRLQGNVIDLSMLVLEVDGAWRCDCCGAAGPRNYFISNRVKFEDGKVDRRPRCPACLKDKRCPCYRKEPKPHTETTLTPIDYSLESVAEGMRLVFPGSAFAVYSTHSHQRVTAVQCGKDGLCDKCRANVVGFSCGAVYGHEIAELCYRLVVPLVAPVPLAHFPALWLWATNFLHESEVIADPQAKDPNRIYYTPVKSSPEAPHEFHVEDGAFFDWRSSHVSGPGASMVAGSRNGSSGPCELFAAESVPPAVAGGLPFACHEDLHAELCRRIEARGKKNGRGHVDAKCLAHNGRGHTSLVLIPESGAVFCNAGCDYWSIVVAEGLPEIHLPSRNRLAVEQTRRAASEVRPLALDSLKRSAPLKLDQLSIIYELMLAHCFELSSETEAQIRKDWPGHDPFSAGEPLELCYGANAGAVRPVKICSMPNQLQIARAVADLSSWFDLREVPGFFVELQTQGPQAPGVASARERWQTANFSQWRLNLPSRKGLLVPRYTDAGYCYAIQIYRDTKDRHPTLLTSRGLPGGAKAIAVREERAA